jgi:hypothetical protein
LIDATAPKASPTKLVTRAVAWREARRQRRRTGPKALARTITTRAGTAMVRARRTSMASSTETASTVARAVPVTSSQTSTRRAMSWVSSRNRLTASPEDPGSRSSTGPGSDTSESRRARRIAVCQPTHTPWNWTTPTRKSAHRVLSIPASTASAAHGTVTSPPPEMASRTRPRASPVATGSEWNSVHQKQAMAHAAGSRRTTARARRVPRRVAVALIARRP